MDWDKLFFMQRQLDRHIEEKHNMDKRDLFESKYLALLVELGELANETRCFKFWSKKEPSVQTIILEEYVDGLHFILSLGLEKGYEYTSNGEYSPKESATDQFNKVYKYCELFHENTTHTNYTAMFHNFLVLGATLGFNEELIMEAYKMKNEKNYLRQEQGY